MSGSRGYPHQQRRLLRLRCLRQSRPSYANFPGCPSSPIFLVGAPWAHSLPRSTGYLPRPDFSGASSRRALRNKHSAGPAPGRARGRQPTRLSGRRCGGKGKEAKTAQVRAEAPVWHRESSRASVRGAGGVQPAPDPCGGHGGICAVAASGLTASAANRRLDPSQTRLPGGKSPGSTSTCSRNIPRVLGIRACAVFNAVARYSCCCAISGSNPGPSGTQDTVLRPPLSPFSALGAAPAGDPRPLARGSEECSGPAPGVSEETPPAPVQHCAYSLCPSAFDERGKLQ